MEGSSKQKLLSNLLKRDESIIGIIVAEKDSAIPVLSSYSSSCSETVDRHRPFIGSTITLMRNSNKLGHFVYYHNVEIHFLIHLQFILAQIAPKIDQLNSLPQG